MSRPAELSPFRAAAAALAVLVLVQAVLAGQFLTGEGGRGTHRLIGEALGLVALVVAAAGYRLRAADRDRWWLGLALLVMVVAQTGLGFAGRDSTAAAALHVPLGVATFGVGLVAALPRLR
ncbi:MAG: hypothetical protein ACT4OV_08020 [Microthrixaceae bacterium]